MVDENTQPRKTITDITTNDLVYIQFGEGEDHSSGELTLEPAEALALAMELIEHAMGISVPRATCETNIRLSVDV